MTPRGASRPGDAHAVPGRYPPSMGHAIADGGTPAVEQDSNVDCNVCSVSEDIITQKTVPRDKWQQSLSHGQAVVRLPRRLILSCSPRLVLLCFALLHFILPRPVLPCFILPHLIPFWLDPFDFISFCLVLVCLVGNNDPIV